jgi:DUF971 family protein
VKVPQRIEIQDGSQVVVAWDDGSAIEVSALTLRAACPCAGCREPEGMEAMRAVVGGTVPVTIDEARLVGGYAVSFVFAPDGHGTGIYPFDWLAELGDAEPHDGSPS